MQGSAERAMLEIFTALWEEGGDGFQELIPEFKVVGLNYCVLNGNFTFRNNSVSC